MTEAQTAFSGGGWLSLTSKEVLYVVVVLWVTVRHPSFLIQTFLKHFWNVAQRKEFFKIRFRRGERGTCRGQSAGDGGVKRWQ